MQLYFNSYSIILIISGISAGLFSAYIFYRLGEHLKWLVFTLLSVSIWSLFYGFQLASSELIDMLFWVKMKYLGISLAPSTWLLFCIKYTGKDSWLSNKFLVFIFAIPLLTYLFVLTNEWHYLHYSSVEVSGEGSFSFLKIQKGPWYFIHTFYFYFSLLLGNYLLIKSYKHAEPTFKKHIFLLVISTVFPWVVNICYMIGYKPYGHIDLTPFIFIISYAIIALGLIKFDLFDVIPIAKDKLISAMTDGVLVIDVNAKVLDINPAMKNILGQKILIGHPVSQIFPGQEELMDLIERRVARQIEITARLDQGQRQYSVEAIPLFEEKTKFIGLLLLFKNITEVKKNQDLVKRQSDQLKQHNELKDKLFSIISHDLKGPIFGVKEIIDMAKKGMMTEEDIYEILPDLSKSVDGVTMLMENLLAWSRSQLQGEYMNKVAFDVIKLIQQQKNLMEQTADSKKVNIEIFEKGPIMVLADKNMIELVVRNLLNNSIKFCEKGDSILMGVKNEKDLVRISVKDTGVGISQNNLNKLRGGDSFSTFGSNNESGTGLGLLLVRDYVEKNGGNLSIESVENEWSEFSFLLPKANVISGGKKAISI